MAAEARTIEVFSRHTGKVRVKVKGESRVLFFEEIGPELGRGMVDNDEAEVLLGTPALAEDFWKEGVELNSEQSAGKPAGDEKPKGAKELIDLINSAATIATVDMLVEGETRVSVLSAADVRREELKEAARKAE